MINRFVVVCLIGLFFFPFVFGSSLFGFLDNDREIYWPADINGEDIDVGGLWADFVVVRGDANFFSNVGIDGDLYVDGNINFTGDVNISGFIDVNGVSFLDGGIDASGDSNFYNIGVEQGIYANRYFGTGDWNIHNAVDNYSCYYDVSRAAFACGGIIAASGAKSVAFGQTNKATGAYSGALYGFGSEATADYAMAGGNASEASQNYAIALGNYATASGESSVAIGASVSSLAYASVTLGSNLTNYNANSLLIQDLNVLGNANVDGTFVGDTNFTNIGFSGNIYGDGSNLTGISALDTNFATFADFNSWYASRFNSSFVGDSNFVNIGVSENYYSTGDMTVGKIVTSDKVHVGGIIPAREYTFTVSGDLGGIALQRTNAAEEPFILFINHDLSIGGQLRGSDTGRDGFILTNAANNKLYMQIDDGDISIPNGKVEITNGNVTITDNLFVTGSVPAKGSNFEFQFNNDGILDGDAGLAYVSSSTGGYFEMYGDAGDGVDLGADASLNILNTITVSAWVNPNGANDNSVIVSKDDGLFDRAWLLWNWGTNKTRWYVWDSGGSNAYCESNIPLVEDVWTHVVGVYDGTSQIMYINGVAQTDVKTRSITIKDEVTVKVKIGAREDDTAQVLDGQQDEVMIFKDALSPTEVSDLFDLGRNAGSYIDADLVSHYRADDGTADDDKGINDGTLNGNAIVVSEGSIPTSINITLPTITRNLDVNGDLNVEGKISFINPIAKYHRVQTLNTAGTDWNAILWDLNIPEESTEDFYLIDNNQGINVKREGVYYVNGCIHSKYNGVSSADVKLAVRVLYNGVEARCLQASRTKTKKQNDVDTLEYSGTIYAPVDTNVTVQYKVDNADLDLEGDTVFDSPVAASINFGWLSAKTT